MTYTELIEIAAKEGFRLDKVNIRRMKEKGLLPQPKMKFSGRHGNLAFFPVGADNQLLEICRLKRKNNDRYFIAWNLWLSGFDVSVELIKGVILKGIEYFGKIIECINSQFDGLDSLDKVLNAFEEGKFLKHFSYKQKKFFSATKEDTSLFTLIMRLFLRDKQILKELYYDIGSKEQIYIDKIQYILRTELPEILTQESQVGVPKIIESFNTINIVKCFKDIIMIDINKMKKAVENIKFNSELENARHFIGIIIKTDKINADWQDPMASFVIAYVLADRDLSKLSSSEILNKCTPKEFH